ncbi:hypothetical protein ACFWPX_03885 [Nocardia sp. NPDC058518]|uniref:hypothetical protein n=1 Tax=Nocardia sp. NPDC058518 TaxID=3346534 RepID=UPI003646DED2
MIALKCEIGVVSARFIGIATEALTGQLPVRDNGCVTREELFGAYLLIRIAQQRNNFRFRHSESDLHFTSAASFPKLGSNDTEQYDCQYDNDDGQTDEELTGRHDGFTSAVSVRGNPIRACRARTNERASQLTFP